MISFENVTKTIQFPGLPPRNVLDSVGLDLPSDRRIALLTSAWEEKGAVIDLIAGATMPTRGRIVRDCRVSYPVGFFGGFSPELPVRQNVAHTASLYDMDAHEMVHFVRDTVNIGWMFEQPFGELPNPVKFMIGFVAALAIPFDVYLIRNDLARAKFGSNEFKKIAYALFETRARTSGIIVGVSNANFAREYCDMGLVLHQGRLVAFDDVPSAYRALEKLQAGKTVAVAGR